MALEDIRERPQPKAQVPPVANLAVEAARRIVLTLAGANLAGLLALMALRAGYPFELEWIESATVDSARWILAGHWLYERPRIEFIPLLYTPLSFYLSAGVMALVGPGFLGPRLVSILATIATAALIVTLVRHETGKTWAGIVGAGFYAATFHVTGLWMDVARSDSLLLLFVVLAGYLARRLPGRWGALGCAAALSLAYFTKQSVLPILVAFGVFYLLEPQRNWLVYWPAATILIIGPSILLDRLMDGWYSFYTWYIVSQHILDAERIRAFWLTDLLGNVPVALASAAAALMSLGTPFRRSIEGSRSRFYLTLTAGTFAASWWNRAAAGAHTNTLIPAMACLGILLGLMLVKWLAQPPRSAPSQLAVWLGVAAQFLLLVYDPRAALPTRADHEAGEQLLAEVRSMTGPVFIPGHSYYAAMAGKPTFAHWATITDASGVWDTNLDVQHGGENDPRRQIVLDELDNAIRTQYFSAIILHDTPKELDAFWRERLDPYYRLDGRLFDDDTVFWTISGAPKRPQLVFVPR